MVTRIASAQKNCPYESQANQNDTLCIPNFYRHWQNFIQESLNPQEATQDQQVSKKFFNGKNFKDLKIIVLLAPDNTLDSDMLFAHVIAQSPDAKVFDEFAEKDLVSTSLLTVSKKNLETQVKGWDSCGYTEWKKEWENLLKEIQQLIDLAKESINWSQEQHRFEVTRLTKAFCQLLVLGGLQLQSCNVKLSASQVMNNTIQQLKKFVLGLISDQSEKTNFIKAIEFYVDKYLEAKKNYIRSLWNLIRLDSLIKTIKNTENVSRLIIRVQKQHTLFKSLAEIHQFQKIIDSKNTQSLVLIFQHIYPDNCFEESLPNPTLCRIQNPTLEKRAKWTSTLSDLTEDSKTYELLRTLKTGDKLQVDCDAKGQQSLSISVGNNQTTTGWLAQSAQRKLSNWSSSVTSLCGYGSTAASQQAVIQFLTAITAKERRKFIEIKQTIESQFAFTPILEKILKDLIDLENLYRQTIIPFEAYIKGYEENYRQGLQTFLDEFKKQPELVYLQQSALTALIYNSMLDYFNNLDPKINLMVSKINKLREFHGIKTT